MTHILRCQRNFLLTANAHFQCPHQSARAPRWVEGCYYCKQRPCCCFWLSEHSGTLEKALIYATYQSVVMNVIDFKSKSGSQLLNESKQLFFSHFDRLSQVCRCGNSTKAQQQERHNSRDETRNQSNLSWKTGREVNCCDSSAAYELKMFLLLAQKAEAFMCLNRLMREDTVTWIPQQCGWMILSGKGNYLLLLQIRVYKRTMIF